VTAFINVLLPQKLCLLFLFPLSELIRASLISRGTYNGKAGHFVVIQINMLGSIQKHENYASQQAWRQRDKLLNTFWETLRRWV